VQDAVPLDGRWLAAMIEDLEDDPLVAGVYGRGDGPHSRGDVGAGLKPARRRRQGGHPVA
jgi:hypothetical protein